MWFIMIVQRIIDFTEFDVRGPTFNLCQLVDSRSGCTSSLVMQLQAGGLGHTAQ